MDRVKWLDFWLACRALDDLSEAKDGDGVKAQLGRMAKDFFGSGGGVSLSNDAARKECAQICSKQKSHDLRPMWLAQERVMMEFSEANEDLNRSFDIFMNKGCFRGIISRVCVMGLWKSMVRLAMRWPSIILLKASLKSSGCHSILNIL